MKKLNVGVTKVAPKKSNHAHVEVGERLEGLLHQFIVLNPTYKQAKAQHETLSKDIGAESRDLYWSRFAGITPESSTMIATVDGRDVQLIVKDAYSKSLDNEAALIGTIGQVNAEKYFEWKTTGKLDFDQVPPDKQDAFAQGIAELRANLDIPEEAVVFKQYLAPKAGFHAARTILLTPEENSKLDAVLTTTAFPMLR